MSPPTVLIVGAGLAGARAAETLRAEGFDGRVLLVGEEPVAPYERPALSKEFLAGKRDEASLLLRKPAFWEERGIELLLGRRVLSADPLLARRPDEPRRLSAASTSSSSRPARGRGACRSPRRRGCTSCGRSPTRARSARISSRARASS